MPPLPVPQAALVQCMGSVDQQLTIIDLSFVNSAAVTEVNLSSLVTAVATWFTDSLALQLSDDWSATRVVGTDLSDPVGARVEAPAVAVGGVSGEANPNNVAACVSFRTAQRGRSGHGRNFVPGIPGSVVTLNTIDDAWISNILLVYQQLVGPGTFAAGWQFCVVSRQTGGLARPTPLTIPITSVTMVTNKVKSMRSREVGHGA